MKTATSAHPREWARQAARLRYHWQAAHYLAGCAALDQPAEAFPFVVVESAPPHLVAVYELDDDSLMAGHRQLRQAMNLYAECLIACQWPGYGHHIETIRLPAWAITEDIDA